MTAPTSGPPAREDIQALPKVALHDHLDGGLRPATLIELAQAAGHVLPTNDPDSLADWFFEAANSGSLERYLTTFDHTIAVMQTAAGLRRVAREFVEDQAADAVVYAEARWAPQQHTRGGLTMAQAVEAVRDGLADGVAACAQQGRRILVRQLLTAMRQLPPTTDVAELAVAYCGVSGTTDGVGGVCGFDVAGPEAGFPPGLFESSFELLREHGVPYTIHAGEAWGLASVREAVDCGASRLGHGVRLIEDVADDGTLGAVASVVADRRIALELCPTSNLQTGLAATLAEHPFQRFVDLGFRVTVSCDNRLMSRTTLSRELSLLTDAFGYGLDELAWFQRDAAAAAFCSPAERLSVLARLDEGLPTPE